MALAYDNIGTLGGSHSGTSTTWSHNNIAGNLLVVGIFSQVTDSVTAATYDGVSMILANSSFSGGGGYLSVFYLYNPSTGNKTVSVSTPGTGTINGLSVSYTGAGSVQMDTTETFSANTNNAVKSPITTVNANAGVVFFFAAPAGDFVSYTSGVALGDSSDVGFTFKVAQALTFPTVSPATVTVQANLSGSFLWTCTSVSFRPPSSYTSRMMMLF